MKRTAGFTRESFHRSIGRSPETVRFAAALASLLRDRPLTVREVLTTGRIAAGETGAFKRAVEEAAGRIANGESLAEALGRHPRHFDSLYRGLLEATRSRDDLRVCLERLGQGER